MIMILYLCVGCILILYAHLYLHFFVNPNNHCSVLSNLTKEDITDRVYTKLPFLMDGSTLRREIDISMGPVYDLSYESIPFLEPHVRFYPTRKIQHCLKKKWIETNDACRTFYRIHKGSFRVTCIHPSKKDYIQNKKEWKQMKKKEDLIHLTLHEDSVLFLPNDWSLYVEPLEDSILEKIQYYTPLNIVANSISKIFKNIDDAMCICSMKGRLFI